ncbi:hypothetical protein JCM1841_005503 [Sporobolomyces salmonicolor]
MPFHDRPSPGLSEISTASSNSAFFFSDASSPVSYAGRPHSVAPPPREPSRPARSAAPQDWGSVVSPSLVLACETLERTAGTKLYFVETQTGRTHYAARRQLKQAVPYQALEGGEAEEEWVFYEAREKVAVVTEEALYVRGGHRIDWSTFYRKRIFSRISTWKGPDGKRYRWQMEGEDLKLIDDKTKEIVACVQERPSTSPRLIISALMLPSVSLMLITWLHRRLQQRLQQRQEARTALERELDAHEIGAW